MAGVLSFKRGREYLSDGAVSALLETEGKVEARVRGTRTYRVRFWIENKSLGWSCDCPHAEEGNFCKHCVAAGLAWLAPRAAGKKRQSPGSPSIRLQDVRTYLAGASKGELVELLMEQALESARLRRRLERKTAQSRPGGPDVETIRETLRDAIRLDEFAGDEPGGEYAEGVEDSIAAIGELLAGGDATAALELSEYAAQLIDQNAELMDLSGGELSLLQSQLHRIHHSACKKAKLTSVALAKRLSDLKASGEYGMIGEIPSDYADLLGRRGMIAYRRYSKKGGRKTS